MHRVASSTIALLALATLAADECHPAPFFDGKTTKGWEGKGELWRVADGAIVGSTEPDGTKANTFLVSQRKYKDFELKLKVRLKDGKGNSGIQIRSELIDPAKFVVKGPQADIGEVHWGGLYGEQFGGPMKDAPRDKVAAAVKAKDFNDYAVKVVGKRVTITINGVVFVDEEFAKLPPEGVIAFQIHGGGPMEVTFKDIEFKELK